MKDLAKYIKEGILDADLVDKDPEKLELVEAAFSGFYSKGIQQGLEPFLTNVIEMECVKVYMPLIEDALLPIIDDLKGKKWGPCKFMLRELEDAKLKIVGRLKHFREDIPDYNERVLKMVTLAHELDALMNKLSKKYKNGGPDDVYVSLNVRKECPHFDFSADLFDDVDKVVDTIKKHKFTSASIRHIKTEPDDALIISFDMH